MAKCSLFLGMQSLGSSPASHQGLHLPNALPPSMNPMDQLRIRQILLASLDKWRSSGSQINLLPQPPRLSAQVLSSPPLLALLLALRTRQNRRAALDRDREGGDDALDDVVHVAALRGAGRKLNHVALAQGVAGIGDQVASFLRVVFADVLVPEVVAVENGHGALHASDGDDGAGLEGVGVVAEERGRLEGLGW